jgi:hypothetical protein
MEMGNVQEFELLRYKLYPSMKIPYINDFSSRNLVRLQ